MVEARVKARRESVFAERFAVFAECLLTGVWIAVACLGLVTYPAAFAAGASSPSPTSRSSPCPTSRPPSAWASRAPS